MERNDSYYSNRSRDNYGEDRNRQFDNYRDRYSGGGNYYGMPDQGYEYRNVKNTGSTGSSSSGPMQSGKHDDYRTGGREHYHYGDPNPYMGNNRNRDHGAGNEFGWRSERDTRHSRGNNFGGNDRYARQDNSYRYSGEGRHYNEFARDENRTDDRYRSYNAGTADHYLDRGPIRERREDNDYGRNRMQGESPYYEGTYDNSDFKYSGEIRSPRRGQSQDNYGTGLYASNRANVSEHRSEAGSSDGERRSSRERRQGRSGPDYGAWSGAGSYGDDTFGV
ncbi:hypothetical protein ABID22_003336 [Pontibacter aydingkolensis]|uniref:SWFGD domain-containing protein n=1 Tax=Pontibacter aydingkolensis TaxID=1911536 RepID=A0ABS7CU74_9BACT|nr:hypothetical protein [Pontibacter aydingkolensis]MBW7467395.1 hypothetical protein [Pontibacter aydingkolensis]